MKIVKLQKEDSKISRRVVYRFGESVYRCSEVESVFINIRFKDGTAISFRRSEEEDEIKELMEKVKGEYGDR